MKDHKTAYTNIKAPDALKRKVDTLMKKTPTRFAPLRNIAITAVCAFLLFAALMNLFPSVAYAASGIPVLGSLVKVVTFNRYAYSEDGFKANIVTPKLEGLLDPELEARLNADFKEYADALAVGFEQDIKELKAEMGDEGGHMGIESNYIVKTDNEDFLAIDVYTLDTVGSSSTVHSFFTVDKKARQLLTLSGLFKAESDYIAPISTYLQEEMRRQNAQEEGMFWVEGDEDAIDGFARIAPDQNFYIDDAGHLVICFDKYEVAAGAQGSPEFVIPLDKIEGILLNANIR